MPLRLPQVRDFDQLRRMLQLVVSGLTDLAQIGIQMGARPRHAARYAGLYVEAADVLGLLDRRRWAVTARGRGLIATAPHSDAERSLLKEAVATAEGLGDLRWAVLAEAPPTPDTLTAYVLEQTPGLSGVAARRRVRKVLSWRDRLGSTPTRPARTFSVRPAPNPSGPQLELLNRTPTVRPSEWPHPLRVPFNWSPHEVAVVDVVLGDVANSDEVLLVMGYTSLQELCHFVAGLPEGRPSGVRVVFGNEPSAGQPRPARSDVDSLGPELRDYWRARGISLLHAHAALCTLAASRSGRLRVRTGRRSHGLHAKMFVGRDAVTVGSSNFTDPGLRGQLEANLRLTTAPGTRRHFDDARKLAEVYWKTASGFDHDLQDLLHELLQVVSWPQALARGCAELLEGRWAEPHLSDELGRSGRLWPSQRQGVGQALYVLMDAGAVLIADARGSGKTRTGAWLLRALRERLVATGRRISDPVLVSPPVARAKWTDALHGAEVRVGVHNRDVLDDPRAEAHARVVADVESARILALDEAQALAAPSPRITTSLADQVILLSSTPVDRDASDLLGIAELLGPDNLDEQTLAVLEETFGPRGRELSEADRTQLRQAVRRFTVRRTKAQLDALIDREPHRYHNLDGEPCRYPSNEPRYYPLKEPVADRAIADQIAGLARSLSGVLRFRTKVLLTRRLERAGWTPQSYLQMRLHAARTLVRHQVRAALRSSGAALWAHLHGAEAARRQFELGRTSGRREATDRGVLAELDALAREGPPVVARALTEHAPEWLLDPEAHARACEAERRIYAQIAALAAQITDARELHKVAHLVALFERHTHVVGFDARPITLALLQKLLADAPFEVLGPSEGPTAKRRSAHTPTLTLYADAVAHDLDLQQVSAVVHLDLPSMVRVAEKRIEGLDRMDSPHSSVESWWPKDAPEFALSADERLDERLHRVEDLLGADVTLPSRDDPQVVGPEALLEEMARKTRRRTALLDDAFSEVRGLVEGARALVPGPTYAAAREGAEATSQVAVVRAQTAWGFFVLPGSAEVAPRWIFVDAQAERVTSTLDEVANALRERLDGAQETSLDARAAEVLRRLFDLLQAHAASMLPLRKQRALTQMKAVLRHDQKRNRTSMTSERAEAIERLLGFLDDGDRVDLDALARAWLTAIRPRWRAELERNRRARRLRRIEGLTKALQADPLPTPALVAIADGLRQRPPLADRVVAAIVGVPEG